MDDNQYFYNTRNSNTYTRSYVSINDVIMLKRSYCVSKSLSLSRKIVSFASLADSPNIPYVAVFLSNSFKRVRKATIQTHGNAKRTNATSKPYYRTSNDVLAKTKKLLKIGMQAKAVYDKINHESGGAYTSSSQRQELRDTRQVYRQEKESVKKEPHYDLSNAIRLPSQSCRLIQTISITGKSYQVFLGNDVQLQDAELFCCDNNGVLSVNTPFNLCVSWFTYTCYYNKSWVNSDGHNPVFLGPTLIHFQKDPSIFRRLLLEMCAHNPKIRDLRTIGTDQEMAIFNGFSSILPNLNLLLCVHHLE